MGANLLQTVLTVLKNGRVLLNKQELEVADARSGLATAEVGQVMARLNASLAALKLLHGAGLFPK